MKISIQPTVLETFSILDDHYNSNFQWVDVNGRCSKLVDASYRHGKDLSLNLIHYKREQKIRHAGSCLGGIHKWRHANLTQNWPPPTYVRDVIYEWSFIWFLSVIDICARKTESGCVLPERRPPPTYLSLDNVEPHQRWRRRHETRLSPSSGWHLYPPFHAW